MAPTSVTATLASGGNCIHVTADGMSDYDSVHVVLVSSLAYSFQEAYKTGNVHGFGNVIAWSSTKFPVSVNVSDNQLRQEYKRLIKDSMANGSGYR